MNGGFLFWKYVFPFLNGQLWMVSTLQRRKVKIKRRGWKTLHELQLYMNQPEWKQVYFCVEQRHPHHPPDHQTCNIEEQHNSQKGSKDASPGNRLHHVDDPP